MRHATDVGLKNATRYRWSCSDTKKSPLPARHTAIKNKKNVKNRITPSSTRTKKRDAARRPPTPTKVDRSYESPADTVPSDKPYIPGICSIFYDHIKQVCTPRVFIFCWLFVCLFRFFLRAIDFCQYYCYQKISHTKCQVEVLSAKAWMQRLRGVVF